MADTATDSTGSAPHLYRNDGRTLQSFSHPDCNCRPLNLTGSAFPVAEPVPLAGYTAGGDFHPAPKDSLHYNGS
jgi:hypothetical protein